MKDNVEQTAKLHKEVWKHYDRERNAWAYISLIACVPLLIHLIYKQWDAILAWLANLI